MEQSGLGSLAAVGKRMEAYGRNGDTMLVHMTPEEVGGLHSLAEAHGGKLTLNPHTGLYEASFLKKLLPAILGAGLMFIPGVNALAAAAMVGGGYGIAKGSLKKGLMAGLSAYGGASLAGGLGAGAAAAGSASTSQAAGLSSGVMGGVTSGVSAAGNVAAPMVTTAASPLGAGLTMNQVAARMGELSGGLAGSTGGIASLAPNVVASVAPNVVAGEAAKTVAPNIIGRLMGPKAGILADNFSAASRAGLGGTSMASKYAPRIAATGLLSAISGAFKPKTIKAPVEAPSSYRGPYIAAKRVPRFRGPDYDPNDSSEFQYFDTVNPYPSVVPASSVPGYNGSYDGSYEGLEAIRNLAAGGPVSLDGGGFVVDARTVAELGNGSSSAGQEILARLGGQKVKGKGDGVSDSVNASIDGGQRAKVARDEVKFSRAAVTKIGRGDPKRGVRKLYGLMAQAQQARKTATPGQDTGLSSLVRA